jgi:prolyl-tRNA synthetase
MTTQVDSFDDFKKILDGKGGFVLAHWDGTKETEAVIKEETKATIRCIPLNGTDEAGACVYSGKPSARRVLFAEHIELWRVVIRLPDKLLCTFESF